MGYRRLSPTLALVTVAFVAGTSTARAAEDPLRTRYRCQTVIAKQGARYVNAKLRLLQECWDANLVAPTSCAAPDAARLQKLVDRLRFQLAKKCSFTPGTDDDNLRVLGFPGPCDDDDAGDGFTLPDLQECIQESHDKLLEGVCDGGGNTGEACTVLADCPDPDPDTSSCRSVVSTEYDSMLPLPLAGTRLACQRQVAASSARFVRKLLQSLQKCRNRLLDCRVVRGTKVCRASGYEGATCATSDQKTATAIAAARAEAIAAIGAQCADPDDVATLKLCEPDQTTPPGAATCEVDVHQRFIDNPDAAALIDLLDYEYAARGRCGDNRLNQASEECDGRTDGACRGRCGEPLGLFPCLCENKPRSRVVEHAEADLDNGWKGLSHDSGIVEGGGYVTDLWDCGGGDTLCVAGPSCDISHEPCSPGPTQLVNADTLCPGVDDFCRMTAGGLQGPHCEIEFKRRCRPSQNDCPTPGDRCVTTPHGAPLPIVSGNVAVCIVNTFTEDVVGTTDLATGESAVRLRQNSAVFASVDREQPCPVCGGFCSGQGAVDEPVARSRCTSDADCRAGSHCVTAHVCSWGPDMDKPCRPSTPFGGATEFFGIPSVDCRMAGDLWGTIDILFNRATTGTVIKTANVFCNTPGFNNRVCAGGANQHVPCTVDSECPGGSCNHQCFCPNAPGESGQRPNDCAAACLGGANDGQSCMDDGDCDPPNGFCHPGDCRVNPEDTDSIQEGLCTAGPDDGHCSLHPFAGCLSDADCRSPLCPFCDPGETCRAVRRQCFVNPTIVRQGAPGVPHRTTAATFCIAKTGTSAVDTTAGLSGPGAITNPATVTNVGF